MELVQTAFRDGVLVKGETWQAVVLLLKGGGDYHIIGLVEAAKQKFKITVTAFHTTSTRTMIM